MEIYTGQKYLQYVTVYIVYNYSVYIYIELGYIEGVDMYSTLIYFMCGDIQWGATNLLLRYIRYKTFGDVCSVDIYPV